MERDVGRENLASVRNRTVVSQTVPNQCTDLRNMQKELYDWSRNAHLMGGKKLYGNYTKGWIYFFFLSFKAALASRKLVSWNAKLKSHSTNRLKQVSLITASARDRPFDRHTEELNHLAWRHKKKKNLRKERKKERESPPQNKRFVLQFYSPRHIYFQPRAT